MKKPAARLTDMTAHGGTIGLGMPTVLIGGQPAARVTDLHVCPMTTGNVPHGGGPIQTGSTTVLIGGQKAARVGDMVSCSGPPDTITSGCQTVLIGTGAPMPGPLPPPPPVGPGGISVPPETPMPGQSPYPFIPRPPDPDSDIPDIRQVPPSPAPFIPYPFTPYSPSFWGKITSMPGSASAKASAQIARAE